jgi:hypothetical protein
MKITQKTVTKEKGHGRIEKREYLLEINIDWLPQNQLGGIKSDRCDEIHSF